MIKYCWALFKDKPVHINEVTIEMREADKFYNIVTGERMTAYLNVKFQKHFHHIQSTEHDNETYLHETAKLVFADTYAHCVKAAQPFYLEYWQSRVCLEHFNKTGIICDLPDNVFNYDLTNFFTQLKVESRYNIFKPDIQLLAKSNTEKEEVIFIEIYVTHKSTAKKLAFGKRTIEIKIQNESDILNLRQNKISVLSKTNTFFNFRKKEVPIDYCSQKEKGCRNFITVFILYKNGVYEFATDYLENIIGLIASEENSILMVDYKPDSGTEEKKEEYLIKLSNKQTNIKDCRLCRYSGANLKKRSTSAYFCKFLKLEINPESAFECKYFRKK